MISKNNKKIVTLIPFGIFGKYEGWEYKFISNSIMKNIFGLPIKIKQNVVFDYLYIDDLIPVIKNILKNEKISGDINITPDNSIDLVKISKIINKIGKNKSKVFVENEGLNFEYTGNNQKLKNLMPDIKYTSYNKSILELYKNYCTISKSIKETDIIRDSYFKMCKIRKI